MPFAVAGVEAWFDDVGAQSKKSIEHLEELAIDEGSSWAVDVDGAFSSFRVFGVDPEGCTFGFDDLRRSHDLQTVTKLWGHESLET